MNDKPTRPEVTEVVGPPRLLSGKFRINRLIGEGGMGSVYVADHLGLDAQVAVKILAESCVADPDAIARFRREAKAMAAVRHDNVVTVMDTGSDEAGVPFIVMEYLEGETLSSVLARSRSLAPATACRVADEVLSGVAAAHAQNIVHRDLKPSNIFMARLPDGRVRAKILDFGVSKLNETSALSVTADGVAVGTPTYMAPEQIQGLPSVDLRADIYAVGVILYRMLSGKLPYIAGSAEELAAQILEGACQPLADVAPAISAELAAAVHRAMSVRPGDRFADARAFRAALASEFGDAAADAPTVAASPSARRELTATARAAPNRRRVIAGFAAIAAVGGVAGLIASRVVGRDEKKPRLRFAVTGYLPERNLSDGYAKLVAYLGRALDRSVDLKIAADTDELTEWLRTGAVDFAGLSAGPYVKARKAVAGLRLLATPVTRSGKPSYRGSVLVRVDSGISRLIDLKGRPFCFVKPDSTSGWLMPRRELRASGVDPSRDLGAIHYGQDHVVALKLLAKSVCDAASVYTALWHGADEHGLDPASFRSIADYSMPNDAYVAAPQVTDDDAARLRAALLSLAPGSAQASEALDDLDSGGFVAASDEAFAPIAQALADESRQ